MSLERVACWRLTTSVHEAEKLNLEQIEAFLKASEGIRFEGENRQQVYRWVEQVLRQQQYQKQGRKARGLLRRYLGKMTGRSRAQVTRLIARYRDNGELQPVRYRRHRFPQRYTRADVELLATVDEAHETLSGPATRHILQRAYQQYGQPEYQRLAVLLIRALQNVPRGRSAQGLVRLIDGGQQLHVGAGIALREAVPPIADGLELSVVPIAGDQPRHLGPAPAGHLPQVAPQQAARLAALFLVLLLAQNLLHPAVNLLAIFAFEPDAFAGF